MFLDSLSCSRSSLWYTNTVFFYQRKWMWGLQRWGWRFLALWGCDHSVHSISTTSAVLSAGQSGHQKPEVIHFTRFAGAEWAISLKPWWTWFVLLSTTSLLSRLSSRAGLQIPGTERDSSEAHLRQWGREMQVSTLAELFHTHRQTHGHTDTRTVWQRFGGGSASNCRELSSASGCTIPVWMNQLPGFVPAFHCVWAGG